MFLAFKITQFSRHSVKKTKKSRTFVSKKSRKRLHYRKMHILKRTIQWIIGILASMYLLLQAIMILPWAQHQAAHIASSILRDNLKWDITIERIQLGLGSRLIIDHVRLNDEKGNEMVHISRVAAKIDILPMLKGQIYIANAQLFGTRATLYQNGESEKPNFQFVLDTFKSDNKQKKPLDLHIGTLLLRRINIKWDKHHIPQRHDDRLDINHLDLRNIALTAHLRRVTRESLSLNVKRMDFVEHNSHFKLEKMRFDVQYDNKGFNLEDFTAALAKSTISIPQLHITWSSLPHPDIKKEWYDSIEWTADMDIHADPQDLTPFISLPYERLTPVRLAIKADGLGEETVIHAFHINSTKLNLNATAQIHDTYTDPQAQININNLHTSADIYPHEIIKNIGATDTRGTLTLSKQRQIAELTTTTHHFTLRSDIDMKEWNHFDAKIATTPIIITQVIGGVKPLPIDKIHADFAIQGSIRGKNDTPEITADIHAQELILQEHTYSNVRLQAAYTDQTATLTAAIQDPDGVVHADVKYELGKTKSITTDISLKGIALQRLNITNKLGDSRITADLRATLSSSSSESMTGKIDINDLHITDYSSINTIIPRNDISIETHSHSTNRLLRIRSDYLTLDAQGNFGFNTVLPTIQNILHKHISEIIPKPTTLHTQDKVDFKLELCDTTIFRNLMHTDLLIPQPLIAQGSINGNLHTINLTANVPDLTINNNHFANTQLNIQTTPNGKFTAELNTDKRTDKHALSLFASMTLGEQRVRLRARGNNNTHPSYQGEIDLSGTFIRMPDGSLHTNLWLAPSIITIADKLWTIHPATIKHYNKVTNIQDISLSDEHGKSLNINGLLSTHPSDTLSIILNGIDIAEVLETVNFRSVDFGGKLNAHIAACGALSNPTAHGTIQVKDFSFNHARQGDLILKANWGQAAHQLNIEGTIQDNVHNILSHLRGTFLLGTKNKQDGMDLHVQTRNFNLAFLRKFTRGIFGNIQGQAQGNVRVFGPFKHIDLEGRMYIPQASASLPMLGTEYTLRGDSVILSPGIIAIKGNLHDRNAHTATINGALHHRAFKDMKYNFDISMDNFLGFDQQDFGESVFKASVIASGKVRVNGQSGRLTVDIDATPQSGTSFTYNVSTPDAVTNTTFVHYKQRENKDIQYHTSHTFANISSDLFLNFNLHMTPQARLILLMNPKSGETIELQGSGHLIAKFHNKGRFQMFGTYRTQGGYYRLNIQDVIRRDFRFAPDGVIIFGGDPMLASLNLRAVYSVPNVSIDDLATTDLGFGKTQVDCIMNLTGQPRQPQVTFDFDLPQATEDERQMVRSIVSTEEERNMQAVYLLGMGRFFNTATNKGNYGQDQSITAVNSLLSSTLSTQLNQFIANATGTSKWSFGANFKTGDDGWRNMDVEGMLSGTLFDDRLIVGGNFGYREKYYTQRNFISDVTIQYLLTKNGNVSLKAYNKANDRYFVQSSLNTQGIGIQIKKDFNTLSELFDFLKRKKPQKTAQ